MPDQQVGKQRNEPPFLTQPTTPAPARGEVNRVDQLLDLGHRLRPALIAVTLPVLVVIAGLIYSSQQGDSDEALSAQDAPPASAFTATASSVALEPAAPRAAGGNGQPAFVEPVPQDGFDDEPPPPPPTQRRTTTTAATTTTLDTATSVDTTDTTATTVTTETTDTTPVTEPPPPQPCQASVKKTDLRAEPRNRADVIAQIPAGTYPLHGESGNWLQISAAGTTGWVKSKAIRDIVGDCG